MQHEPLESTRIHPVVLAPTYNNAGTLLDVLNRIQAQAVPLIVIDDGSTDDTAKILCDWRPVDRSAFHVLKHDRNHGKAAALRTGFDHAARLGFSHALTIDTDGQHDPEQIPDLLSAAQNHPYALILGVRDMHTQGYPWRSRLGRRFSNSMIRCESAARIADSQCGFRVYPLKMVQVLPCLSQHYAFETEILTRAAWARRAIVQVPVNCRYLPPEQRVSHFRPVVDSGRSLLMHARLLLRATYRWPGMLARWLSPMRALRDLRHKQTARREFAAGVAVGVFIACLPAYGIQSLLSLFAAKRFNLHPLSVLAGSQLSIPPIMPVLILTSLALGHLLLHGTWPSAVDWKTPAEWSGHALWVWLRSSSLWRSLLLEWLLGGVALGLILALAAYGLVRAMFRLRGPAPVIGA